MARFLWELIGLAECDVDAELWSTRCTTRSMWRRRRARCSIESSTASTKGVNEGTSARATAAKVHAALRQRELFGAAEYQVRRVRFGRRRRARPEHPGTQRGVQNGMKRIVVLSDGTGNGAAKAHKTNVWRLYNALDLHRDDQVAMYDDGVGSQEFLLFKLLGGAFGWGLKRNVVDLYKFLCRNYVARDPQEESDTIYLFGFSRGAFTVRVLAGLIDRCGLCTNYASERELHAIACANYAIYRKRHKGWRLASLFPSVRHRALIRDESRLRTAVRPRIAFIGVWDTVDAYGLPVDELADLWDRFIFAMRFPDRQLSQTVRKACHAVSIDDERHTFHPVLWDETTGNDSERIEQVWFPGVHSDVGGGYPRHELALVSLDWMISKVEATQTNPSGLVFLSNLRDEYRRRCDWSGVQHDSRAGLRAFYRYRPRDIEDLSRAAGAGIPKLHRSVFERIREDVVPYAPTGLPAQYNIVTTRGQALLSFETNPEKNGRRAAMNSALDVIYWRRWLYRAFVATTLLLVASPVLLEWQACARCAGLACLLDPVCGLVESVVPDLAVGWVAALCQNPGWLAALAVVYAILSILKHVAATQTFERAVKAWSVVKRSRTPLPRWQGTVTSKLRDISAGALGRAIRKAWWAVVSVIVLVAVVVAVNRLLFHIRDSTGILCEPSPVAPPVTHEEVITFRPAEPCVSTRVALVAGSTYRFDVRVLSDWMDGDLPAGPDGFDNPAPSELWAFKPFRRHVSRPWFELTGRVGRSGGETFPIGAGTCYTAKSNGPLYLYVNDAVFGFLPGRWWAFPYFWSLGLNSGSAIVNVAPVGQSSVRDRVDRCTSATAGWECTKCTG